MDPSHQRDRVNDFARNVPALTSLVRESKGGVMWNRNKIFCTVNIRPSMWKDKYKPSQFWIGGHPYAWAQYLADAIFHYTGKSLFHFKDAKLVFPVLEVVGTDIDTTVTLTTKEMRLKYVQSIAGEEFSGLRQEFIDQVVKVMEREDFILQGKTLLKSIAAARIEQGVRPVAETAAMRETAAGVRDEAETSQEEAAASQEEVAICGDETAVLKEETNTPAQEAFRNEGDDSREETPPIEEDNISYLAIRQSQQVSASSDVSYSVFRTPGILLPGSDWSLVSDLDLLQGYAPSFEINLDNSTTSLESVGQSLEFPYFNFNDSQINCFEGQEDLWNWQETPAELDATAYRDRYSLISVAPELEPGFGSIAQDSSKVDPEFECFSGIPEHMIADAEKRILSPKRRKIDGGSMEENERLFRSVG